MSRWGKECMVAWMHERNIEHEKMLNVELKDLLLALGKSEFYEIFRSQNFFLQY